MRLRGIALLQGLGALLAVYGLLVDLSLAPFEVVSSIALAGMGLVVRLSFQVWRGDPKAMARMQWLLAAQIPWLNLHELNVHYDFYFILACTLRLGNASEPLELGIGSALNAFLGTRPDSAFLGVNLVALALLFLFRSVSRPWHFQPAPLPG
jgi:hypothetical protein